jgi:hypothetical protein
VVQRQKRLKFHKSGDEETAEFDVVVGEHQARFRVGVIFFSSLTS